VSAIFRRPETDQISFVSGNKYAEVPSHRTFPPKTPRRIETENRAGYPEPATFRKRLFIGEEAAQKNPEQILEETCQGAIPQDVVRGPATDMFPKNRPDILGGSSPREKVL